MEFLFCPTCVEIGSKSELVQIFYGSGTLGYDNNFIDEKGYSHWHNNTIYVHVYRCSNGHEFKNIRHNKCSTTGCNWGTGSGGTSKNIPVEDFFSEIGIS